MSTPTAASPLRGTLWITLLAAAVGAVAGLGAVVFRGLIALVHNLAFFGRLSWSFDANLHAPASPWGVLVVLVPVVGAVGVAGLVQRFAPEAKGHGVPEVMDAIYYNRGVIRPVVAVVKSLASALSIGTGGSVGREGPIIQIGASLGSTLGQLLRLTISQRVTLIAAGTAGGIAATFNTPVGGLLFAVEIVLHEVGVRTLVPVAVATAAATTVGQLFFGTHPSFVIPALQNLGLHRTNPVALLAYVGLGAVLGLVATGFIRAIYGAEDFFEKRVRAPYVVRHMGGMLVVGVLMYGSWTWLGHYYVEGVGYATVQDILSGQLAGVGILLLLFALKLAATSLTLGSGASGGVFSPALFMGATVGGAYGVLLERLLPGLHLDPVAFAVAGMAGVVAGATGAAIAAIVMIFEMTLDYGVIVPMTLTVAVAYGVRRVLCPESIYTMKLVRRGHTMPDALQANLPQRRLAGAFMDTRLAVVAADLAVPALRDLARQRPETDWYLVVADDTVHGVMSRQALADITDADADAGTAGDLAGRGFVWVTRRDGLYDLAGAVHAARAEVALVTDVPGERAPDRVRGIVTWQQIASALAQTAELFNER